MSDGWLKKRLELEKLMGADALFKAPGVDAELAAIANVVSTCTLCRLSERRTQTVFARGSSRAALMFIGEGPGAEEDAQGLPFVGPAGKLLDKMVAAMGLELPPDVRQAIDDHVRLLLAWTTAINLTAIREPAEVARLHVLDSLAAVRPLRAARGDA